MTTRELLKDKVECYATDKNNECNIKMCKFYWTCISNKRALDIGSIKTRESILDKTCY